MSLFGCILSGRGGEQWPVEFAVAAAPDCYNLFITPGRQRADKWTAGGQEVRGGGCSSEIAAAPCNDQLAYRSSYWRALGRALRGLQRVI